jgi:hypothetical protein
MEYQRTVNQLDNGIHADSEQSSNKRARRSRRKTRTGTGIHEEKSECVNHGFTDGTDRDSSSVSSVKSVVVLLRWKSSRDISLITKISIDQSECGNAESEG